VSRWIRNPERKPYTKRASKAALVAQCIRALILSDPFLSSRSLAQSIHESLGVQVSKELVRVALKRQGFTRKKARFHGRPPDLADKVSAFVARRDAALSQGLEIVSMDETSFGRHGRPVMGYAPKGQRLLVQRQKGPHITTTSALVGVSSTTGKVHKTTKGGAFNSDTFAAALSSFGLAPGTVVLLDNASIHHTAKVRAMAERAGLELLYVPPYSPWFNPVEGVFSIMKRHFYKHGDPTAAMDAVTRDHVMAFFRASFNLRESPAFIRDLRTS
jgi:transposase